jgi:hypothetical protein
MNNIKEFKELIEKYSSITLEKIEEVWNEYDESYVHSGEIMHSLTGFGGVYSCSLCKAIGNKACGPNWNEDPNCKCCNCVYIKRGTEFEYPPCIDETYEMLDYAESPQELYDALQKRIEFMKEVLKYYEG